MGGIVGRNETALDGDPFYRGVLKPVFCLREQALDFGGVWGLLFELSRFHQILEGLDTHPELQVVAKWVAPTPG